MIRGNVVLLAGVFPAFFCISLAFSESITIQTAYGGIEGYVMHFNGKRVGTFLGIPFVKPPIGDLRFKRPYPIEPWNETIKAKMFRGGCVQYSPDPLPTVDHFKGVSEDCLYLNIWAPLNKNRPNKKTVMFWIHGGDFKFSSSRLDFFNGYVMAAEGDVIVVSTNYRLGPQGFLYSGTEDAPGNMGLLDCLEALKWVRLNINSFGGDRDSITLFGQSAGSTIIGMFCVSPMAKGLFKRVIMQSGSPTNLDGKYNDRSLLLSQQLAEAVGCGAKDNFVDVKCLRTKDPFELSKTVSDITANDSRDFYPRYGDQFLPEDPYKAVMDGVSVDVDVLIGSNSGEGSSLLTVSMQDVFGLFGGKDPQINLTFGEAILKKNFKDYPNPDAVVRQYLGNVQKNDFDRIREQVFTALGDYKRLCPCNYFAESFAKKNQNKVYYYFFIHRPSYSPWAPWMLAVHTDEIKFVFGYPLRYPSNYTMKEKFLSKRMIRMWSNFAKTGNPSICPLIEAWPIYSKKNPEYKVLDVDEFGTGFGPHSSNCDFFRFYFGF